MKVLVTGGTGFVGEHLAQEILSKGWEPIALTLPGTDSYPSGHSLGDLKVVFADITNFDETTAAIKKVNPDAIIHLAAVTQPKEAEGAREKIIETNVIGTHHVCSGAASLNKPVTFLYISSALVYGGSKALGQIAQGVDEQTLPYPETHYGCSKLAGEFVARTYANDNLKIYIVRPFNHIGPGQSLGFVCPSLALKVASARDGELISVGNLNAFRDFTDVRDIVRAYGLILEKKPKESLFILGCGRVIKIEDVLNHFIEQSKKTLKIKTDPDLLRQIDPHLLMANSTLAQNILGWKPQYSIEKTLDEVYREAQNKADLS